MLLRTSSSATAVTRFPPVRSIHDLPQSNVRCSIAKAVIDRSHSLIATKTNQTELCENNGRRDVAFSGKTLFQPEKSNMARIPILDENDPALDPATREALVEAGQSRGRLVNVYRALANRPEALTVLSQLMQTVYRKNSTLAPQHGELAYMTATSVNDCFY